jgi:hypothetical protein
VLGVAPRYGVTLAPFANRVGTMVAVAVRPVGGGPGGIVVLSRSGKILGFQAVAGGGSALAWSRTGSALAYVGRGTYGAELTEWEIGGQSTTSLLPVPFSHISECAWSPDDLSVLCGGRSDRSWYISQSGTTYVVPGHGQVLAWLAGRLIR